MSNQGTTLEKLQRLETLCRQGYASDIVELTLDKIIAYEIANAQKQAAELHAELQVFEVQYKISSQDFYSRFRQGEMGDDVDFVEWSAFYEMWLSVQQRLEILR
ncbi:hypothetical protein [Argonema antarcticum]|uniref:hypothetical protein n=1 Tax=Argonema antarcticum TaxID=2942763 RepID=UPI0020113556|nr:hypothetical protein [Argonema antarcticum]MCL1470724.1 hypothetical protein [Argonema antarcticum A004/B2]